MIILTALDKIQRKMMSVIPLCNFIHTSDVKAIKSDFILAKKVESEECRALAGECKLTKLGK